MSELKLERKLFGFIRKVSISYHSFKNVKRSIHNNDFIIVLSKLDTLSVDLIETIYKNKFDIEKMCTFLTTLLPLSKETIKLKEEYKYSNGDEYVDTITCQLFSFFDKYENVINELNNEITGYISINHLNESEMMLIVNHLMTNITLISTKEVMEKKLSYYLLYEMWWIIDYISIHPWIIGDYYKISDLISYKNLFWQLIDDMDCRKKFYKYAHDKFTIKHTDLVNTCGGIVSLHQLILEYTFPVF